MPEEELKILFGNMLPPEVYRDLHRQRLTTLQESIDFVLEEIGRYNDRQVARTHENTTRKFLDRHCDIHFILSLTNPRAIHLILRATWLIHQLLHRLDLRQTLPNWTSSSTPSPT